MFLKGIVNQVIDLNIYFDYFRDIVDLNDIFKDVAVSCCYLCLHKEEFSHETRVTQWELSDSCEYELFKC